MAAAKPARVALVGVGGYGGTHLAAIERLAARGLCSLAAAVIRDESRHAAEAARLRAAGVRIHRSLEDLLARERGAVELVILATGIPEHAAQTVAALGAGFAVLCEKPAAGCWADALRMKAASEHSGLPLAIGYQHLQSASLQRIRGLVLAGRLGRLLSARGLVLSPRSAAYYERNRWAGRMSLDGVAVGDSPIQNAAGHYLMNLLSVAGGMPQKVVGESYRAAAIEGADTQCVRVTTNCGCRIDFAASHAVPRPRGIVAEYGLEGGRILWRKGGDTEVLAPDGSVIERFGDGPRALEELVLEDAIVALRAGRPPLCGIEAALAHSACVELLFRSAAVRTVDRQYVRAESGGDGRPVAVIQGIEGLMEGMYAQRSSFSEAGAPWAAPGRPLDAAELGR